MAVGDPARTDRALLDFMNSWHIIVFAGGVSTYLAGRVVLPLIGKSAENYPSIKKISTQLSSYWAFSNFSAVSVGAFTCFSDLQTVLKDDRNAKEIRAGERHSNRRDWVNVPNDEMTFSGDKYDWAARRLLATSLKMFSSCILVHAGLKGVGAIKSSPSNMRQVYGAASGFMGFGLDWYDLKTREWDYDPHNRLYPNSLLRQSLKKDGVQVEDFDNVYKKDLQYRQMIAICVMALKAMSLISSLSKAEVGGLTGRIINNSVFGTLVKYSNDVFHLLFMGMIGIQLTQKLDGGASKAEWSQSPKKSLSKYLFKDLAGSREFIRLLEATATTVVDFGLEILPGTDLGALGKFAKSFDSFLYLPDVSKKAGEMIDRGWEVYKKKKCINVWKATYAIFKLIGNTASACKFIGAFGGIYYFSSRTKKFGYIKNGFGATTAMMSITEELFPLVPESAWDKKSDKQKLKSLVVLSASVSSLFLNGFGGLATAFGKNIPPPTKQNFKPWVYNFAKLNAAISTIAGNCISASAA